MAYEAENVASHVEGLVGGLVGSAMLGMANSRAAAADQRARAAQTAAACERARASVCARWAVRERVELEADLEDALDDADFLRQRLSALSKQLEQLRADNKTLAHAVLRYRDGIQIAA